MGRSYFRCLPCPSRRHRPRPTEPAPPLSPRLVAVEAAVREACLRVEQLQDNIALLQQKVNALEGPNPTDPTSPRNPGEDWVQFEVGDSINKR